MESQLDIRKGINSLKWTRVLPLRQSELKSLTVSFIIKDELDLDIVNDNFENHPHFKFGFWNKQEQLLRFDSYEWYVHFVSIARSGYFPMIKEIDQLIV